MKKSLLCFALGAFFPANIKAKQMLEQKTNKKWILYNNFILELLTIIVLY